MPPPLPRARFAHGVGRLRHRRLGHRLRAHRARPWRRRLPDRAPLRPRRALTGGRRRPLHRRGRPLRGRAGAAGEPADHRRPGRGRLARQGAGAPPQLSALLALQGTGHVPGHGPVVHLHGQPAAARQGPGGDQRGELDPLLGPAAHLRHGRGPARLVSLPAALLGCAGDGAHLHRLRRDPQERGGLPAHRRAVSAERGGCLVSARGRRFRPRGRRLRLRRERVPQGVGHPRCLVRLGHQPRGGARRAAGAAFARGPLSRGQRPAPRLVPVLAAHLGGHPRPGALQGRAHPRLRGRRPGQEDVQVGGQCGRPAGGDRPLRRRGAAPVGGERELPGRRQGLGRDPQARVRRLPQDAQHPALSPRQPLRFRPGAGCGRAGGALRDRPLGARPLCRADPAAHPRLRALRVPRGLPRAVQFLRHHHFQPVHGHPQGPPLLFSPERAGAAGGADGDVPPPRRAAPPDGAGALLHRGRGLGAPARPGRQGPARPLGLFCHLPGGGRHCRRRSL